MPASIPHELLQPLSDRVAEATSLHFPPARWQDLRRGIGAAAGLLGFGSAAACARALLEGPALTQRQVDALGEALTVGETYFFREPRAFDVLRDEILPTLLRARRGRDQRLRIWSAACCTGEEAYSIAILLRRTVPDLSDWDVTLVATDLNRRSLDRAEAGVFGRWSFRDAPPWLRPTYFHARPDGRWDVVPEIRRMVRFARLNLADGPYSPPGRPAEGFDVIFCRNVLMYFAAPQAQAVIASLGHTQRAGGWLVVGAAETPLLSTTSYAAATFLGVTLFTRTGVDATSAGPPSLVKRGVSAPAPGATIAVPVAAPPKITPTSRLPPTSLPIALRDETASADVTDPVPMRGLVRAHANRGELVQALSLCDGWIATDKTDPIGRYLRSVILLEQGEAEEAIASLRRALYLDPKFVMAYVSLGNVMLERGRRAEGVRSLRVAVELLRDLPAGSEVAECEGIPARQLTDLLNAIIDSNPLI